MAVRGEGSRRALLAEAELFVALGASLTELPLPTIQLISDGQVLAENKAAADHIPRLQDLVYTLPRLVSVCTGLWEESRFGHSTVRARTLLEPRCPCAGIWQMLLRVHIHMHACTCTHTHTSASITWAPPPSLALGRYIEYITPIPVFSAPTSLPWQQEVLAPHSPLAPTA